MRTGVPYHSKCLVQHLYASILAIRVLAQVPPELPGSRYTLVEAEDVTGDVVEVRAASKLALYIGK